MVSPISPVSGVAPGTTPQHRAAAAPDRTAQLQARANAPLPTHKSAQAANDAKLHAAARQFDAMFMTEMLHHVRPQSNAAGVFAPSAAERSWQVFMDQALGQAAASGGGSGLVTEIEKSLRAAQGHAPATPTGASQTATGASPPPTTIRPPPINLPPTPTGSRQPAPGTPQTPPTKGSNQ
jgi:Rod binding domain-containing protein